MKNRPETFTGVWVQQEGLMASVSFAPSQGPCDKGCGVRVRVKGSLRRTYPNSPILAQPRINQQFSEPYERIKPVAPDPIQNPRTLSRYAIAKLPKHYKRAQPAVSQSRNRRPQTTSNRKSHPKIVHFPPPVSARKVSGDRLANVSEETLVFQVNYSNLCLQS